MTTVWAREAMPMRLLRATWLFGAMLLGCATTAAGADSRAELASLLGELETLTADFEQNVLDARGTVLETQIGRMAIAKPGRLRWAIEMPFEQLVVASAGTVSTMSISSN